MEKVMFAHGLKGQEEVGHQGIWGRVFQAEGTVQRPGAGLYLACFRNSKKSRLASEESNGRSRRIEVRKITRTRSRRALQAP